MPNITLNFKTEIEENKTSAIADQRDLKMIGEHVNSLATKFQSWNSPGAKRMFTMSYLSSEGMFIYVTP